MSNLPFVPGVLPPTRDPGVPISMPAVFFDDFFAPSVSEAIGSTWLATLVDGGGDNAEVLVGASATNTGVGGVLLSTTNNADNDLNNLQVQGASFLPASGKDLLFECRFKVDDVSIADWYVGLSAIDATILTAAAELIGFRCPDSTGDIDAVTEADTTETVTDTTSNLADDTWVTVGFTVQGTESVKFYVDGVLKATHTANISTDEALTPSLELRNSSAVVTTMSVDYVLCVQNR